MHGFSVGQGTLGVRGQPQIASVRRPVPGAPLSLRVTGAAGDAPVFLVFGTVADNAPFLGGTLHVQPLLVLPGAADRLGLAEFALGALPAEALLCGIALRWQALVVDAVQSVRRGADRGSGHPDRRLTLAPSPTGAGLAMAALRPSDSL